MSILSLVLHAAPVRPREVVPAVPRALELVCLKCLEEDPADRYPTAAEVSADLGRVLAGEPVSVRAAKWARRKPTAAVGPDAVEPVVQRREQVRRQGDQPAGVTAGGGRARPVPRSGR
ncbi:MAG: hypothetical protein C0501_08890 [Isosphaera sp.]|nr:hypothetical protein [Isosphaera sp.]